MAGPSNADRAAVIALLALVTGTPKPVRNIIMNYAFGDRRFAPANGASAAVATTPAAKSFSEPNQSVDVTALIAKLVRLIQNDQYISGLSANDEDKKTRLSVAPKWENLIPSTSLPPLSAGTVLQYNQYNLHPVNSYKHFEQEVAIARHMIERFAADNPIDRQTTIVDVGAGRGSLCYLLHSLTGCGIAIIDRNSEWTGLPNIVDEHVPKERFVRIIEDIAHVDFKQLAAQHRLLQSPNRLIIVTKHLCGRATDDVLRVVAGGPKAAADTDNKNDIQCPFALPNIVGFALAPCCSGKMILNGVYDNGYVAGDWLMEDGHLTQTELEFMISKTNWATVVIPTAAVSADRPKPKQRVLKAIADDRAKKAMGLIFQTVLDLGRQRYLQLRAPNLHCQTFKYIAERVTPKNTLILAWK